MHTCTDMHTHIHINHVMPLLIAVDCLSLRDPTNGRVQVSATTYNSIAYYFCNNGYNLVGQQNRKCQYDGTWYGDPPICECKCLSKMYCNVVNE